MSDSIQMPDPVYDQIDFTDRDILEIGCGMGGFTLDYLTDARSIYAIDPDSESIESLREDWDHSLNCSLNLHVGTIENADLPKEAFDIVVFSSSL